MQTFCGVITDGMLDYLVAIYELARDNDRVTTSALAEKMYVSAAATSSMLKRLEETGHAVRSTADGIALTDQGRLAALQMLRRHRLLEVFLIEVIGFTWDQVKSEAHRMEHSLSPAFERRMELLCGYPTHCPHGDPIPSSDGTIDEEPLVPLTEMEPGQRGMLRRVASTDASVLRYLSGLNLMPTTEFRLLSAAPFHGPLTLEVAPLSALAGETPVAEILAGEGKRQTHVLGYELASKLFARAA